MKKLNGIFYRGIRPLAMSFLLLAGVGVQAAPLNFQQFDPVIFAPFMALSYDATQDNTAIDNFTYQDNSFNLMEYRATGITDPFGTTSEAISAFGTGPAFLLSAHIDDNGVLSSGTLTINGTIGTTFTSGLLIQADILDFGFNEINDVLEFSFLVTAGDLKATYDDVTQGYGGVIIESTTYNGNFNVASANYNTSFGANFIAANIAPIPVPAAAWLFGSGLLALGGIARRRV